MRTWVVPATLFDTNIWIASVFTTHPCHSVAQQALQQASPAAPAVFCRATQQSFLRLASTPAILKVYGAEGLTNRDALMALDALQALPQCSQRDEAPGVFALWRTFASRNTASPKVWMDAYLAAFAVAGGLRLLTLDADFRSFVPQGLDLMLLHP
jgi:toxin-antitoxin system PIN domain toxin